MDEGFVRYVAQEVEAVADCTVINAQCLPCRATRQYQPTAMRVTVLSSGLCYYEFFCTQCRGYNKVALDWDVAVLLHDGGVPCRSLDVPAEVLEREDANARPLTEADSDLFMRFLQHLEDVAEETSHAR